MNELLSTSTPRAELHCFSTRHARIITEQQPGDGCSLQEQDHDIVTSPPAAAAMECDTCIIGGGQHRALNNDLNLNWTVQQ